MKTIKTKIHVYKFNVNNKSDAKEYAELSAKLTAEEGRIFFHVLSGDKELPLETGDIELETKFIFSNQWNSAQYRVFDWYEAIYHNPNYKCGHWLEITDEMREIRSNTLHCGYCGAHYQKADNPGEFCNLCLGSEYLKESDLHLLRLKSAALFMPKREPLTDQERAILLPTYVEKQTTDTSTRAVQRKIKIRADVEAKFKTATAAAKNEYDGMIWLLDHGVNIDNCIYYSHTQKFSFGWRNPVSDTVKSSLLDVLCEFHFDYEIFAESGKVSTVA